MPNRRRIGGFFEDWGPVVVGTLLGGLVMRAVKSAHSNAVGWGAPPPPRRIGKIGPNLWVAGLPSVVVERLAAPENWGRQRRQNWCWAAAIQMRFGIGGLEITQEQVVQRIFGGDIDNGGTPQQIMDALSGGTFTASGKPALLRAQPLRKWDDMIDDLSFGNPLIVGMKNTDDSLHAVVVTAVTYSHGPVGTPVLQSVVTRDPWPYNASLQELPWDGFVHRATFIIRSWITYPQGI